VVTVETITSGGPLNFHVLHVRAGTKEGGRYSFEVLVQDLVSMLHPEASTVTPNPGDWGIDGYVGSLLEGEVSVWQAKYYIDGFGDDQKAGARKSYKRAKEAAAEHGYKLASWTLAIPCDLDGPTVQWWENWKRKAKSEDGVIFDLWNAVRLRRLLNSPDAVVLRNAYFSLDGKLPARPVLPLAASEDYEDSLFVRQMQEAGLAEFDDAMEQFFNAEILIREVDDKAVNVELAALQASRSAIGALWATRFNHACQTQADDRFPGLYGAVMQAIEDHHPSLPAELRAPLIHAHGLMHHRVNGGSAGWVRHYRRVAKEHMAGPDGAYAAAPEEAGAGGGITDAEGGAR
jgi:hypothetical protein